MPVERAAPGVEHREEPGLDLPVVLLEELESLRGGGKEQVGGDPVVHFEELVELLGHGKDDVEMGAIGQAFAELLGPFGLAWSEAVRAMAVTAGAGEPVLVVAVLAANLVEAEWALAAQSEQVERRILFLVKTTGPEVAPLEKDVVDSRVDTAYLNSMSRLVQEYLKLRAPPKILSSAFRSTSKWVRATRMAALPMQESRLNHGRQSPTKRLSRVGTTRLVLVGCLRCGTCFESTAVRP